MKKYLKTFTRIVIEVLISTLILSLLSYFNLVSDKLYSYFELIMIILILYFNSMRLSKSATKYSVLEGFKVGGFFVLLFIIINMIFEHKFNLNLLIYYVLLFLICLLASMPRKKSNKKKY